MASHLKNLSDFSHTTIPSAAPYKFAIVVAQWNIDITGALYRGAYDFLIEKGAKPENILSVAVPGSYELTAATDLVLTKHQLDAVICIGCVIKGDTPHFEYICQAVSQGITNAGLKHTRPVIFGVLTTNTLEQAQERAGGKHGNKGEEAAASAILMCEMNCNL